MRLVLVRHGASEHAARGIIAGVSGCTGLTAHGLAQTRALADRLRATGELSDCEALLCSPVPRARQSAEILAGALPVRAVEVDDDLCELRPGAADGLTWETYRAIYGEFDLVASPHRPIAPSGESWAAFLGRVRAAHQRLAKRFAGRTVVAVSHAGFIVASLIVLFDIPRRGAPDGGARLEPVHTALTEWRVSGASWTLVRYNDASHLPRHE
jgi:probable phosphoglycerate mutase